MRHVENLLSRDGVHLTLIVRPLLHLLWPRLAHEVWLNSIWSSRLVPSRARFLLLRLGGFRLRRCTVLHDVEWFGSGRVSLERGVVINRGVVVNHSGGLYMGKNSGLGPGTLVLTASHEIGPPTRRYGTGTTARVSIGAGTWVGANVTILPGVRIGRGCVIAAGSVVTRDCVPDALYAGVPARPVRSLERRELSLESS